MPGVTITVNALTQQGQEAIAAFTNQATASFGKVADAGRRMAAGVSGANSGLTQLKETSKLTKEGIHQLETAVVLLGGEKMAALSTASIGVRAAIGGLRTVMISLGVSMSTALPVIGAIAAAAAAGVLIWRDYGSAERAAAEAAKKHAEALKEIPDLLKRINDLESARLIGPGTSQEARDILTRQKRLYRAPDGSVVVQDGSLPAPSKTEALEVQVPLGYSPVMTKQTKLVTRQFKELSETEYNEYVKNLSSTNEALREGAYQQIVEINRQLDQKLGTDTEQQISKIKADADKALKEISDQQTLAQASGLKLSKNRDKEFDAARDKVLLVEEQQLREVLAKQEAEVDQRHNQELDKEKAKLRENKEILDTVNDIRRHAQMAGLDEPASQLAQIDYRYDREIEKVNELNISLQEQLALIGEINAAREHEKANAIAKFDKELTKQKEEESKKRLEIQSDEIGATADMLGSAAEAAKLFGREGFLAYKAFSIGQASVATALAVVKALAEVPYPANTFVAAAAAAAGAVQIATIAATAPGYERGGRPQPGRVALVGEAGPELFVPDSVGTILTASQTSRAMQGSKGAPSGAAGISEKNFHFLFLSDKSEITKHIRENPDAQIAIVDILRRKSFLL